MLNKNMSLISWLSVCILLNFSTENFSVALESSEIAPVDLLFVLQQGYEICTMLDKIDPNISSQLGIQCQECQHKISCSELGGCLVAMGDRGLLNTFKKLLSSAEVQAINLFMMNVANEQQVSCVTCGKFCHWIEYHKI